METQWRLNMGSKCIFMFLGLSFLSSMCCRNSAMGMIESIGTNSSRYPKGYVTPAGWIRTIFHLKKRKIPRYYYFELMLSLVFAFLGPVNSIICFFVDYSENIIGVLTIFHLCLVLVDFVIFLIVSWLLKK